MKLLSSLRTALRGTQAPAPVCAHLDQIREVTPGSAGCEQCLALGDGWVHLRLCMTCGLVGCCDSSKNRHATRHARDSAPGHQIIRSIEPGEQWMWCCTDAIAVHSSTIA